MKSQPHPIVRLFEEEATEVLGRSCGPTRCLNATRVCLDVMAHFGLGAFPLSVSVLTMNAAYAKLFDAKDKHPCGDDADIEEWVSAGAYSGAIETDPEAQTEDSWPGHLVAIVQKEWIIDSASIQFSRPHKGVAMPDIFVQPATTRFLKGKDTLLFGAPSGARIYYKARLDDASWRKCSGFQPHEFNRELSDEIIARIRARMGMKAVGS